MSYPFDLLRLKEENGATIPTGSGKCSEKSQRTDVTTVTATGTGSGTARRLSSHCKDICNTNTGTGRPTTPTEPEDDAEIGGMPEHNLTSGRDFECMRCKSVSTTSLVLDLPAAFTNDFNRE